jgi:hypothetical protein
MHRRAFELMETALGKEHLDTLTSVNNLAEMLTRHGKKERAEEMHRRALGLRQMVLGGGHPHKLASMNNLVLVLGNEGKYEQAKEILAFSLTTKSSL